MPQLCAHSCLLFQSRVHEIQCIMLYKFHPGLVVWNVSLLGLCLFMYNVYISQRQDRDIVHNTGIAWHMQRIETGLVCKLIVSYLIVISPPQLCL